MADLVETLVDQAIQRWQTQLLQIDRRNKLLYMKADRTSVPIVSAVSPDEFIADLSVSRFGRRFAYTARRPNGQIYEDPGEIDTDVPGLDLQRRLKTLRARDREFTEEQGVNVLFLATGFLRWMDEDGQTANAPLVLFPADLLVASPRDPFYLKLEDDDPVVNATLKFVLSKSGIALPDYSPDSTLAEYFENVRRVLRRKPDWSVSPEIQLSTFQFSKVAMWEDLEALREEGVSHPLVRRMAGDTGNDNGGPGEMGTESIGDGEFVGGGLDDRIDIKRQYLVLPADASQLRAIEAARAGRHLVVHGPPGTGKSQTIANLISTFIADGKRILFVAEKTAALDVVKRRLDEAKLGVFCLDLHSERGKKANVYAQLRLSLETRRSSKPSTFRHAELIQHRDHLNRLTRLLHEVRRPIERSVFQALGRYVALRDFPDIPFVVQPTSEVTQDWLAQLRAAASELASYNDEFREHATSPLRYLRTDSDVLSIEDRARAAVATARTSLGRTMEQAGSVFAEAGWGAPPESPSEIEGKVSLLEHLERSPGVPETWLDARALTRLSDLATRQESDQRRRTECRTTLESAFGTADMAIDWSAIDDNSADLVPDPTTMEAVLGSRWTQRLIQEHRTIADSVTQLSGAAESAQRAFEAVCMHLSLKAHPRRSEGERIAAACADIERMLPLPAAWFEDGAVDWKVDRAVKDGESALRKVVEAENGLSTDYELRLADLVDQEMLVRFRTDYRSFLKRLGGRYKADLRIIQGCSRDGSKQTVETATHAIEAALEVAATRREWEANASICETLLGNRFRGRETNWTVVSTETDKLRSLIADRGLDLERIRALGAPGGREELSGSRIQLSSSLEELRQMEAAIAGTAAPDTAPFDFLADLVGPICSPIQLISGVLGLFESQSARLPADTAQLIDAIRAGSASDALEADASQRSASLSRDFGRYYDGWATDWARASAALEWAGELIQHCAGRVPKPLVEVATDATKAPWAAELKSRLREALTSFEASVISMESAFDGRRSPWGDWRRCSFNELSDLLHEIVKRHGREGRWLGYRRAAETLDRCSGVNLVDLTRDVTDDATLLPGCIERRVLSEWLATVFRSEPELEQFSTMGQDQRLAAFRLLDLAMIRNAQDEVRAIAFGRYPNQFVTHTNAGELGVVQGQIQRKRGHMPVRRLLARAPQIVQALKPCFMMSPLAISQHLERGIQSGRVHFDVVIFDEASQVFPEDAVPAISRADQVIVVGDQKQLPPTSFFRKTDDDSTNYDNSEKDPEDDEDALAGRESVLDALLGLGGGVAQRFLDVHYRSRHEDLIRFSNHMFYRDRLLVFPSPDRESSNLGVRDVYVSNGRYDAGASRTNQAEAERVVELVFELMRTRPAGESVGVVALSRVQASLIERLIQDHRMLNKDLDGRFAEDQPERFFVKNLENVQGDERDHIILSIGYGPTVATGRAPQRFGPINNDGGGDPSYGQRRLNVAVSRARRSFTVVHSLLPSEVTSETRGARTLRRFLEYAAAPTQAFEAEQSFDSDAVPESEFEEAVAAALRLRGYEVQPQVGTAGYRVDLAVWSKDRSRFELGIECDGWTYHSSPASRDRDWLRQTILEDLGWKIHRIWSTSWARDPLGELERVIAAIESARSGAEDLSGLAFEPPSDVIEADEDELFEEDLTEPDDSSDDPEPTTKAAIFAAYTPTRLRWQTGEIRYLTLNQLQPQLMEVIRGEGPVHFEVILMRIRAAYGAGRAGAASRDAVLSALEKLARAGQIKGFGAKDEQFYELPGVEVRARRDSHEETRRDPVHIHGTELRAGILQVSSVIGACERQELIRETWYQFGFERVGAEMQLRMDQALDWLLREGLMVKDTDELLRRSS